MIDSTRITDLEEVAEAEDDAYILIDGATNGTRKISIANLEGGE